MATDGREHELAASNPASASGKTRQSPSFRQCPPPAPLLRVTRARRRSGPVLYSLWPLWSGKLATELGND